jgi:hypothetical protein
MTNCVNHFQRLIPLAAEVDEFDFRDWLAEEVGAEALEFFDGVGGVEEATWAALGFEL